MKNMKHTLTFFTTLLLGTADFVECGRLARGLLGSIHIARAAFEADLPAARDDFEYYVTAGDRLVWPATGPQINQPVVVW